MIIEVKALFVEGIYRKSGALAAIKSTRRLIETEKDPENISLDEIPVIFMRIIVLKFNFLLKLDTCSY